MVTKVLVDTLKDEKLSIKKKQTYIENLDLSYSDIFELINIFKYENSMSLLLYSFISYDDSKFTSKLNYKNRKQNTKNKQKQMKIRRYKNDKY